jgi:hypothetical protein
MSTDAFRSAGSTRGTSEPGRAVAADRVSQFLQGVSMNSAGEIDDLLGELHILRERLVVDVNRIQHELMQYAALGQAVFQLTQVSTESVARMTVSNFAKER